MTHQAAKQHRAADGIWQVDNATCRASIDQEVPLLSYANGRRKTFRLIKKLTKIARGTLRLLKKFEFRHELCISRSSWVCRVNTTKCIHWIVTYYQLQAR